MALRKSSFGVSVAVSGRHAGRSAIAHQVGANTGQGAAYVFVTPPSLAIASPINGATYNPGSGSQRRLLLCSVRRRHVDGLLRGP